MTAEEASDMTATVLVPADPRRCLDCGHEEDRCQCPHDCRYAGDGDD